MKKIIAILVTLIMTISSFSVLANNFFEKQLEELRKMEILVGDDTGNLRLEENITIAEALKMLTSAIGVRNYHPHECATDEQILVPADHWAHIYIFTAASIGYISQDTNVEFDPDSQVDGESALKMVMKLVGYDYKQGKSEFKFEEIVNYAKQYGVIDNKFNFTKAVTRKEFAVLLEKVFDIPIRMFESYDAVSGASYTIADGTHGKLYSTYRTHYINELLIAAEGNDWSYNINQMRYFKALVNNINMSDDEAIERIKLLKQSEKANDDAFIEADYAEFSKKFYSSIESDKAIMDYLLNIGCPSINNFKASTNELLIAIYKTKN